MRDRSSEYFVQTFTRISGELTLGRQIKAGSTEEAVSIADACVPTKDGATAVAVTSDADGTVRSVTILAQRGLFGLLLSRSKDDVAVLVDRPLAKEPQVVQGYMLLRQLRFSIEGSSEGLLDLITRRNRDPVHPNLIMSRTGHMMTVGLFQVGTPDGGQHDDTPQNTTLTVSGAEVGIRQAKTMWPTLG